MSTVSAATRTGQTPQLAQISTQTLLNSLHTSYQTSQSNSLEFSTSLAVNSWQTASGDDENSRGVVDIELAHRVVQHAKRRAEDATVIIGYLHSQTCKNDDTDKS